MIAVIGGGPAGLRAAEVASAQGAAVTLFDAKASVGRKFLVAGGGGLNLTKAEEVERFASRYRSAGGPPEFWRELMQEFGPKELRAWAVGLGIETFAASTGRVYPHEMKAAPLLRRWVQRLRRAGVHFAMHHRWTGWQQGALEFETTAGKVSARADATILALGGGSWPETGSDGRWVDTLKQNRVEIAPLQPANCGWEVAWAPEVLAEGDGKPLKNIIARAGNEEAVGELMITRYGLEGGAIYQLGPALRSLPRSELEIDFKPSMSPSQLTAKFGPAKRNLLSEAQQRWKLSEGAMAILRHHPEYDGNSAETLVRLVKHCRIVLGQPRPLAEAISSAGGVRWSELNEMLMLRRMPGVFVAGEMMDWEAPTGGYLMQGAFATGTRAARGALDWICRIS